MHFLAFSTSHENSVDCAKTKKIHLKDSFWDIKQSNITLKENVKPIVFEKWDFEYRDISKLTSHFCLFGLSGFQRKDQDALFF